MQMDDASELLQFAVNCGMLSLTFIRQEYEKMNRQKILDQTKIWKATDGRWKAYVDVAGKRRLIAKSNRAALEDEIIATYKEPKVKFKECFDAWIEEKLEYGEIQKQTYDRYTADYKRYIHGTELENKEIKTIDELYLENFIKYKISTEHLTAKNWGNMRILISGAMIYARKHGYTDMRISLFLSELQLSNKIFERKVFKDEEQVFAKDEEVKIRQYIEENPDMISLGVGLAFVTGMRVGEVSALRWSDYQGDTLIVQRTEIKYKGKNGEWIEDVRNFTKGRDGIRQVVLTDDAKEILDKLYAYTGEKNDYVFLRDGKRIKAAWLSNKIESLCRQVQIPFRSFHKIRKTYATKLIDAQVPEKFITKQLGHTEILTTKSFYYFSNEQVSDIKTCLEKV